MRLQNLLGLVLATTALSHLVVMDRHADRSTSLLGRAAPPTKISSVKVSSVKVPIEGGTGSGKCSARQIEQLKGFILDARGMLTAAAKALGTQNAEQSPAYKDWFGKHKDWLGTPSASTRKAIRTHNFQAPLADLSSSLVTTTQTFTPGQLDPAALTFTCWPATDDHCRARLIAGTINPGLHPGLEQTFSGTLIGLCPSFFQLPGLREVTTKFDNKDRSLVVTPGLTIVHELQHVLATTGKARSCVDHAYDAELCRGGGKGGLNETQKITNAQNMALFALDITAHPERACSSPKAGCCWC